MTAKRILVVGVDPGSPLYLALISAGKGSTPLAITEGKHVALRATTGWQNQPSMIADLVRHWQQDSELHMVAESVSSRPGEGAVSIGKYLSSFALMQGIAAALMIPFYSVSPQKWRNDLRMPNTRLLDNKEVSRQYALSVWPGKSHFFSLKKDHNKAEAALIALWGKRFILNFAD